MTPGRRSPAIRVRRRHAWTIIFRADVSDEVAEGFITTGRANFGQDWLDHIQITGPLCYYCEQDFERASWGCPGEAGE